MADQGETDRLAAQLGQDGGAARAVEGVSGDDAGTGPAYQGGLAPGDMAGPGAGGLDSRNLGGGGTGLGQAEGSARLEQTTGRAGLDQVDPDAGGTNPLNDELRAQGAAQGRTDASDAQGLLDPTRIQTAVPGSDPNNDNL
jgi:hypothetical protein